jgi:hypothetical protein
MGEMCELNGTGDTKVILDPKNEDEVEVAEEQFDKLIDKGFLAFDVKKSGDKGIQIHKFNAKAGKIIMVPSVQGG